MSALRVKRLYSRGKSLPTPLLQPEFGEQCDWCDFYAPRNDNGNLAKLSCQYLGQIIQIVDDLVKHQIRFIAIKENIQLDGRQDMHSKVMVTMFGLFAEIERDLISERTREGLVAARAKGHMPGRPKGSRGQSLLDGKEAEIRMLLGKKVSKAAIAKIMDVSRSAMLHFIRSRGLGT